MDYKIIWSNRSKEDFKKVIEYLNQKWSPETAELFISVVNKKVDLLPLHPMAGVAASKDYRFRKIVLTRQNTLYYFIEPKKITLLRIFDTRQHTRKLKLHKR